MSNPEPQFRVAEIELNQSTLDEKIVGIFRYDSESRQRSSHSTILIVAEIASTLYAYEQLLDTINATVEQVRHLVAGVDADPVARFEKLTTKINEAIAAFGEHEPAPLTWNRINLYIIQLSEGHLCLSGIGHLANVFLQKQKDGAFRAFDLLGSLEQPAEVDPQKPFASLICGDIHTGDVLFAGSSNFQRMIKELDIEERLKTLPPVTAAMEIRQALEDQRIPDDYAAVIVAGVQLAQKEPDVPAKPELPAKPRSTESIERLREEEEKTEAMLSPTLTPLSKVIETDEEEDELDAPQTTPSLKERIIGMLHRIEPPRKADEERAPAISATSLQSMSAGHGTFLSRKRKLQIIAGVILVVAIGGGTLWFLQQRAYSKEQASWNKTYDQAVESRTRAEADLVYGNEESATSLVKQAEDMATGLDEKTADRKRVKQEFLNSLTEFKAKLRHETTVASPDQMFVLPATSTLPTLRFDTFYHDRLYTVDEGANALVEVEPATKASKYIPLPIDTTVVGLQSSKDILMLLTDAKTLLTLDAEHGRVDKSSLTTAKATSTNTFALYGKRLYMLDPLENMIWKYNGSASGFSGESPYLKQNTHSLGQATSLAIDSNVYVSFSDGSVTRYLSGAEEPWRLNAVDPVMASAASLWTTPDTDRLVIADPVAKRILVFRKDGRLVAQIKSPAFQNPTAVTGDDKAKKIYVTDGSKILQLDLP